MPASLDCEQRHVNLRIRRPGGRVVLRLLLAVKAIDERHHSTNSPQNSKFSDTVPDDENRSVDFVAPPSSTMFESGFAATQPPGPDAPQPQPPTMVGPPVPD